MHMYMYRCRYRYRCRCRRYGTSHATSIHGPILPETARARDIMEASEAASEAAQAVALARQAARSVLADAAGKSRAGNDQQIRMASALQSVQAACGALDDCGKHTPASSMETAPILEELIFNTWRVHGLLGPTAGSYPETLPTLLAASEACVPRWLLERSAAPLQLSMRGGESEIAEAGELPALEMCVEGAFRAVVAVAAVGTAWVPVRVAVGPSNNSMPAGARQPPTLLVFHDVGARAGTLLAGLEALPPARRLRPLLSWLCSLHNLFESRCAGCGSVFPPLAVAAADLLPPTARDARRHPWHPACFTTRFGRTAEAECLEAAARSEESI